MCCEFLHTVTLPVGLWATMTSIKIDKSSEPWTRLWTCIKMFQRRIEVKTVFSLIDIELITARFVTEIRFTQKARPKISPLRLYSSWDRNGQCEVLLVYMKSNEEIRTKSKHIHLKIRIQFSLYTVQTQGVFPSNRITFEQNGDTCHFFPPENVEQSQVERLFAPPVRMAFFFPLAMTLLSYGSIVYWGIWRLCDALIWKFCFVTCRSGSPPNPSRSTLLLSRNNLAGISILDAQATRKWSLGH